MPPAGAAANCSPVGDMHFVCGPKNAEDLVLVPNTKWIVATGMGMETGAGNLYLVNADDKRWNSIYPQTIAIPKKHNELFAECPGPPDVTKFSSHGAALRPGKNGIHTLYVVNHGGRESVEVFSVDGKPATPVITWIGCAEFKEPASLNAVAPLPDGGFVVTKMYDPSDPNPWQKMNDRQLSGATYEWHPDTGYQLIPNSELSGNNGVEVSDDGKWLFVAAWSNHSIVRYSREDPSAKPTVVSFGFLMDNIRRAPDGQLFVTGHNAVIKDMRACKENCLNGSAVWKLDPATMKTQKIAEFPANKYFGDATVALQVDDHLWIGTFRGDRIAYVKLK
jgi:hypothetical protein